MVEVEIVRPVSKRADLGEEALVDLVVEIVEVYTGPRTLKGREIQLNPIMVSRFPPERWCAYGMNNIYGAPIEFYPVGKKGLLWIFQRKELPTSFADSSGYQFPFVTGFVPVWDRSEDLLNPNHEHFVNDWNQTRSMMQILQGLEDIEDSKKAAMVFGLLEHENPKVRKWALGALVRMHGVKIIPILRALNSSEARREETKNFINGPGTPLSWDMFSGGNKQRVASIPLIGVEVLTQVKTVGDHTLFSKPEVVEPGTVKVLRVFAGSGIKAGDILEVASGDGDSGDKFLVWPRDRAVRLPSTYEVGTWSFPPEGPWDGEWTLFGGKERPRVNIQPMLPWLERLSGQPRPYADEFLDEAIRDAPLRVALWALQTYREQLRIETVAWLREQSGLVASDTVENLSLRNLILYDSVMRTIFRKLWEWDVEKIALTESILSHPLSDDEEAWLLYDATELEYRPSSATSADWMRLANAARNNASWKEPWLNPIHRQFFERVAWHHTWRESISRFDASPAVTYLVNRWAIPDRGEFSGAQFTDNRGSMLSRSMPLEDDQIEVLRLALEQRLTSSGEPLTPEIVEEQVSQIKARTRDEIIQQPYP
ncbi:MAG: HEAT repeat domain-containing protein [Puniceicoccaceae bacterium]